MDRDLHRRLIHRIARVTALRDGATTEGEREAAVAALKRVRAKLRAVQAADSMAVSAVAEVKGLGVPGPEHAPEASLCELELIEVLARWEQGDWTWRDVERWAHEAVDSVVLPTDPSDRLARVGEVMLQLTTLSRFRLRPSDVPAIRRFLRTEGWDEWFELVASLCTRRRAAS